MATLELSSEEQELLQEILKNNVSDLRMEISDTDSSSFKSQLHQRKDMIKGILEKLKQQ